MLEYGETVEHNVQDMTYIFFNLKYRRQIRSVPRGSEEYSVLFDLFKMEFQASVLFTSVGILNQTYQVASFMRQYNKPIG